jgi:hypothetical protein
MLSKSILSYTLFRSTKAVAKAGFDAVDNHLSTTRGCRCLRCGWIDEATERCERCGTVGMFKMYKQYEEDANKRGKR